MHFPSQTQSQPGGVFVLHNLCVIFMLLSNFTNTNSHLGIRRYIMDLGQKKTQSARQPSFYSQFIELLRVLYPFEAPLNQGLEPGLC